jgi:hypothetical protein
MSLKQNTIIMKKKVLSSVLGLSAFAMILLFNPQKAEAACNPGHESTGVQSWGPRWSLKCDQSNMSICCSSTAVEEDC